LKLESSSSNAFRDVGPNIIKNGGVGQIKFIRDSRQDESLWASDGREINLIVAAGIP
jgi:hypothetical protein